MVELLRPKRNLLGGIKIRSDDKIGQLNVTGA